MMRMSEYRVSLIKAKHEVRPVLTEPAIAGFRTS